MKTSQKRSRALPKTITEQEFLQKIALEMNPKRKLAFMLGFYGCMRVSEVVKLKLAHIDYERGFIHIIESKGRKDRDIPIPEPIKPGLKHLPIGRTRRSLNAWSNERFGLNFHALRHSGATHFMNVKNMDIRTLQAYLGHASIQTTQIYTHVTPKDLADKFNQIWQQ